MHILISNDDGIFAPGILALARAAVAAGHRVTIYAPDDQRSAASHSVHLRKALRVRRVELDVDARAYSVDGTPADCVRVGLYLTRNDGVDCVLSGVNNGPNRGAAILYSGTVAAAMEASMCGVPAVAVSLCGYENDRVEDFAEAAKLGVSTAEWAAAHPLPRGEIYNLNVPNAAVKGLRAASVSYEFISDAVMEELGDDCYRLKDSPNAVPESDANSDLLLTQAGYATLSVLTWNLQASTPMPELTELQAGDLYTEK